MANTDFFNLNPLFDYLFAFFDIFGQIATTPWGAFEDFISGNIDNLQFIGHTILGYPQIVITLQGTVTQILFGIISAPFLLFNTILVAILNINPYNLLLWQALLVGLVPLSILFFFGKIIKSIILS